MEDVAPVVSGRRSGRALSRLVGPFVMVGVAALGLVACGDSGGEPGGEGDAITVEAFQFKPSPLEVVAGTAVVWTNNDDIGHTVTAGAPDDPDGLFDGPLDGQGATFSFTFEEAGTYRYFCSIHPSMLGEIRVT
ncbi:MAG: cupredoxin domain-containing protein [Actinomycetota bacterium]